MSEEGKTTQTLEEVIAEIKNEAQRQIADLRAQVAERDRIITRFMKEPAPSTLPPIGEEDDEEDIGKHVARVVQLVKNKRA